MSANTDLETWPYDWQSVEETLDVGTIEAHGHYMLHRALNTKRLIAFVGSGVSMAYGRVTWSELAKLHVETVSRLAGHELAKEQIKGDARMGALVEYIDDLNKEPDKLYNARLSSALHACEQVWRLAAAHHPWLFEQLIDRFGLKAGDDLSEDLSIDGKDSRGEEQGSYLFRQWIKRETLDERLHVRRLVHGWQPNPNVAIGSIADWIPWSVLERYSALTSDYELQRPWAAMEELTSSRHRMLRSGVGKQPQHYAVLFHRHFIEALASTVSRPCDGVPGSEQEGWIQALDAGLDILSAAMRDELEMSGQEYLRPVHGFAVGLALDVARLREHVTRVGQPPAGVPPPKSKRPATRGIRRHEMIPPKHDPLHRLAYHLGIRRYLTTNYDLEIERLFVNMGFEPSQDADVDAPGVDEVEMIGPGGGRTRDIVLTEKSAIDLIDFAANDSPHEFQVVHLHGRATERHDVVVTEADYQKLYVRETASQTAFKEGIEIAFGGNPILFLGLSLSEGDILRPLREFMTGSSRRNRSVVALRDARGDSRELQTFTKTAYARHGVMVIHYGRTRHKRQDEFNWLSDVNQAVLDLVKALKVVAAALRKGDKELTDALDNAAKCRFARDPQPDRPDIWKEPFKSDDGLCDIKFEITVLTVIQSLVAPVAGMAHEAPFGSTRRAALIGFLTDALQRAAERTRTALVSAALNAKLEGLAHSWSRWWAAWRDIPRNRSEHARYERRITSRAVWFRHLDDSGSEPSSAPAPGDGEEQEVRRPDNLVEFHNAVVARAGEPWERRVFLLMGPQGAGKGLAYNTFARHGDKMLNGTRYIGQLLATFSFGMEIASVWDALIGFLDNPVCNPNYLSRGPAQADDEAIDEETVQRRRVLASMSRVDALRRVVSDLPTRLTELLKLIPREPGLEFISRVLVVLNAFDITLGEDGHGKNSEVQQILELLLGAHAKAAPIDLVPGVPRQSDPRLLQVATRRVGRDG